MDNRDTTAPPPGGDDGAENQRSGNPTDDHHSTGDRQSRRPRHEIVAQVRALLRLAADSAAAENEREMAMRRAAELIEAHGISQDELNEEEHPHEPGAEDDEDPGPGAEDAPPGTAPAKKSNATRLVELALAEGIRSWRTPTDDPHVTFSDGTHLPLYDRRVRGWARRLWFRHELAALKRDVVSDALGTIEGLSYQHDDTHEVHHRVAGDTDAIYLHLGHGEPIVEVTADGWRLIDEPPVRFVARAAMHALPRPERGGSLEEIRDLHPALRDDHIYALVASYLVGCLRPWGSYAILALIGEQGSAKSSLARTILRILDPTEAELRSPPRDTRDLAAAVRASRIVALDNMGQIQPWLSDALCTIATGGSFAARALFTDADEHLVSGHQPIIMTAIDDVITAGDLRERSLVTRLPPMPDGARMTDREVAARIQDVRPRILGGLLDVVARGLRRHADIDGSQVHRLADHVTWALACEPMPREAIQHVHLAQRDDATSDQLGDPIGEALVALGTEGWDGSTGELLAEMERRVPEDQRGKRWPKGPRGMGSALRRKAPALRRSGIEVKEGDGYGPRRNRRGATLWSPGKTSGTSATSGSTEITKDFSPDVGRRSAATSDNVGPENGSDSGPPRRSDVPDIPPEPPDGWKRDSDSGEVYCAACGGTQCVCDVGRAEGVLL